MAWVCELKSVLGIKQDESTYTDTYGTFGSSVTKDGDNYLLLFKTGYIFHQCKPCNMENLVNLIKLGDKLTHTDFLRHVIDNNLLEY